MKKKKLINIFEYVDYRFFLQDYYTLSKKSDKKFTYRSFAQKASVSPSVFKDVLSGRQNLTISVMEKYADAMGLGEREKDYFDALVTFNNSTSNREKNSSFEEMIRLRGRSPVKFLDIKKYQYFSKWYHPVVKEVLSIEGIGDNPELIAGAIRPKITVSQAKKSIELLKELGLIYLDSEGKWKSSDIFISSEKEIRSLALKNYHMQMLELGKEAIGSFSASQREFQGLTLSGSNEIYRRIKERIRIFTDEIIQMITTESASAEKVFQLNVHLYPFIDNEAQGEE